MSPFALLHTAVRKSAIPALLLAAAGTAVAGDAVLLDGNLKEEPPATSRPYQAPVLPDGTAGGDMQQLHDLQLLQEEVRVLRGAIEELQAELARLRERQADRYIDLDNRLQELRTGMAAPPRTADKPIAATPDTAPVSDEAQKTEKEQYDIAMELTTQALRTRQYEPAVESLRQLVRDYPDGQFTANAYYWLGEVFLAGSEPDPERAAWHFEQILTLFPNSRQVPDATYKLGVAAHLTGDCTRAEQLLRQVQEKHVGRSIAGLAERYLKDSLSCPEP